MISGCDPWVGKIPWRRKWQPTPVFLPVKSYRQRSLAGYSPRGRRVGQDSACTRIMHLMLEIPQTTSHSILPTFQI